MPQPTPDEIATISREVANHLPSAWTASEDDAYLILGPEGMSLYLNHHRNRIFGQLPKKHQQHLTDEQLKARNIGVNLTRPPEPSHGRLAGGSFRTTKPSIGTWPTERPVPSALKETARM